MIPRCDTCSFRNGDDVCHRTDSPEFGQTVEETWWCSKHPDAPKAIWEIEKFRADEIPPGWEPFGVVHQYNPHREEMVEPRWLVVCKRHIGNTVPA